MLYNFSFKNRLNILRLDDVNNNIIDKIKFWFNKIINLFMNHLNSYSVCVYVFYV